MFVDRFFEMEENCHLFDFKSEEGFPVWDLFRFHVYAKYFCPSLLSVKSKQKINFKILVSGTIIIFRSIFSFFFKNAPDILLSYSRHLDNNGYLFDKVTQHVVDQFKGNILIVENVKAASNYLNRAEYNFSFLYRQFASCKRSLSKDIYNQIEEALTRTFGEMKVSYDELDYLYENFLKDYYYYHFYFKLKKVKRLFLVQNGIQKGMYAAANSLGIEIFEFQHGSFGKDHLAYSYPPFITEKSNIIAPKYLLTFGNSWGCNMNIPIKVIPIGNDYFAPTYPRVKSDDSVLFISSLIHGEELSRLASLLSKSMPYMKINFKLHANEYFKMDYYTNLFTEYPNIFILRNEFDLSELIAKSRLVVLINSTVLYEAINQKSKVAIYKKMNYLSQSDSFNLSNVFLFETLEELQDAIKVEKKESDVVFFEKFNQEIFNNLIKTNNTNT